MTHSPAPPRADTELELATFHVGGLLIGTDIRQVEEINRQLDITPVPHAPDYVLGVLNLRGEVVTVIDLRQVLGLGTTEVTSHTRNIIVTSEGEPIGLVVDAIDDVITVRRSEIEPPPANLHAAESRPFDGVCRLDEHLLMVLNISTALALDTDHR